MISAKYIKTDRHLKLWSLIAKDTICWHPPCSWVLPHRSHPWPSGECGLSSLSLLIWTLARGVHVLWLRRTNSHRLQKSCGEKGMAWTLSKWERERERERALTPAWTGFYCFSGHITLRMVLIYYAQVCCRWLTFTDNKGKNVANYFKEKNVTDQGEKLLNWLHSILGRLSTDFRKLL